MMMTLIIGMAIVLFSVLLDQGSKQLMLHILSDLPNKTIEVIPNFFRFALRFNTGAAFSSFDGDFALLMAMTAVATVIFIFIAMKANIKKAPLYTIGIYMMIGGMIGNFIDRVFYPNHAVVDFLSFTFFGWDFAVFNIADSFLVVGTIIFCIDVFFFEGKRKAKDNTIKEDNEDAELSD